MGTKTCRQMVCNDLRCPPPAAGPPLSDLCGFMPARPGSSSSRRATSRPSVRSFCEATRRRTSSRPRSPRQSAGRRGNAALAPRPPPGVVARQRLARLDRAVLEMCKEAHGLRHIKEEPWRGSVAGRRRPPSLGLDDCIWANSIVRCRLVGPIGMTGTSPMLASEHARGRRGRPAVRARQATARSPGTHRRSAFTVAPCRAGFRRHGGT